MANGLPNAWGSETTRVLETVPGAKRLGWGRLARELTTLEAAAWRKLTVGGAVEPSRCNFSACAFGNSLVLFGGEGVNMQPMNYTFVLDLSAANPEWRHVKVSSPPPGRWGQTLSYLNGSWLVIFGDCGRQGLLNDVFILDLDAQQPTWREVSGSAPPLPRSWHSSCTLDGTKTSYLEVCKIPECSQFEHLYRGQSGRCRRYTNSEACPIWEHCGNKKYEGVEEN